MVWGCTGYISGCAPPQSRAYGVARSQACEEACRFGLSESFTRSLINERLRLETQKAQKSWNPCCIHWVSKWTPKLKSKIEVQATLSKPILH